METPDRSRSETELSVFLNALWEKRRGIAAGTIGAVLLAAAASLFTPAHYEATAVLTIADYYLNESPLGDSGRETFAARVSSRTTYATMISNQALAQQIVERFDLEERLDMTATELLEAMTPKLVVNTSLIVLTVELPDPELARDVCLAFARGAEDLSRQVNHGDQARVRNLLTAKLASADAELDRSQGEIVDFLEEHGREIEADSLSVHSPRLQRLQSAFETALAIRSDIAQRLEGSEITVAGQIADLVLVDPPVLPDKPSSAGTLAVVGGAAVLGLMLSVLIAGILAGLQATRD